MLVQQSVRYHCIDQTKATEHTTQLPHELSSWSLFVNTVDCQRVWETVRPAFNDAGIDVWTYYGIFSNASSSQPVVASGFAYVTPLRGERYSGKFRRFNCHASLDEDIDSQFCSG